MANSFLWQLAQALWLLVPFAVLAGALWIVCWIDTRGTVPVMSGLTKLLDEKIALCLPAGNRLKSQGGKDFGWLTKDELQYIRDRAAKLEAELAERVRALELACYEATGDVNDAGAEAEFWVEQAHKEAAPCSGQSQ